MRYYRKWKMLSPHSQQLHSSSIGFYEHKGKFQLNTVQVILILPHIQHTCASGLNQYIRKVLRTENLLAAYIHAKRTESQPYSTLQRLNL